jgi:hypothetical protein
MNTIRTHIQAGLLASLVASSLASAATPTESAAPVAEASIPFINLRSIRDWQADKREGIWIQDTRKQWYYAKLMGPCIGLDFALSVGFDTHGSGTLDRFSRVIVPDEDRCPITSLTRSDGPPPKKKKPVEVSAEAKTGG